MHNPGMPCTHAVVDTDTRPFFYSRAALIARHTFSGVAGICTYGAPIWASKSLTAFITDDKAPTVPDSPAPLTPRGLVLVGTSFSPNVNAQKSSARGMA